MYLLNRTELLERLNENVVEVHFTKVNGDARIMRCTLKSELIPECPSGRTEDTYSSRMTVWDVEKQDWRSFRLDSVTSVLTPAPSTPSRVAFKPQTIVKPASVGKTTSRSYLDIVLDPRVSK